MTDTAVEPVEPEQQPHLLEALLDAQPHE